MPQSLPIVKKKKKPTPRVQRSQKEHEAGL